MDLVTRVKGILLDPKAAWPMIEREPDDRAAMLRYVAILAAIPAVCGFIGTSIVGVGPYRTGLVSGVSGALAGYTLTFAGVFIVAIVADRLAPSFGGRSNFANAFKVAVYAPTAAWLAGVFMALPILAFLSVLGLYSFYLFWTGLPALMKVPEDKTLGYVASVMVATIIVWVLILFVPVRLLG